MSAEVFASSEIKHFSCVENLDSNPLAQNVTCGDAKADQKSAKKSSSCNDPCHFGIAHFGHGSATSNSIPFHFKLIEHSNASNFFEQNQIDEPYLEAHRRPPRNV